MVISWEPERHLTGCSRLLSSFWKQFGSEVRLSAGALPQGHTIKPTRAWIGNQIIILTQTYLLKAILSERHRKAYIRSSERKAERRERKTTGATGGNDNGKNDSDNEESEEEMADETMADEYIGDVDVTSQISRDGRPTDADQRNDLLNLSKKDNIGLSREPPTKRQRKKLLSKSFSSAVIEGSLFDEEPNDNVPMALSSAARSGSEASKAEPTPLSNLATANSPHPESLKLPPATSSRPTVSIDTTVLPPVKIVPAHVQRKLNPRVKLMPLPPATGVQGIHTKARIAAREGPDNLASPVSSLTTPSSAARYSPAVDAEKWLKDNVATSEGNRESVEAQSPSVSSAQPGGLHFSKRWRWTGQLAIGDNESDNSFAEPVGDIVLSDNTPLDKSISQFARMTSNKANQASNNTEQVAFETLVRYMIKNEMYSVTELHYSGCQVAEMFVFPSSLEYLWEQINVPPIMWRQDGLLVAIAFQVYKPLINSRSPIQTSTSEWKNGDSFDLTSEIIAQAADSGRAVMTLQFPDSLYKRIAQKNYAIFTTPAEDVLPDPDTLALKVVLRSIPGCKSSSIIEGGLTRCIFIHVSSWPILHKLPGIVHRRLRRPEVLFFTYGSDPIVDPSFWGLQEVFPIGGIVTFTPRAIAENPIAVEKLITQLANHPLWTCYVLPSTIAMIVNVINDEIATDPDPDPKLKSIVEVLSTILIPIEKGQISLTWHPPSLRRWHHDLTTNDFKSSYEEWRIEQACLSDLEGYDLVTECQRILRESQDQSEKDVENTIVRDLVVMQSLFRREYRSTGPCNTSKEAAARSSTRTADIKDMDVNNPFNQFEFTRVEDFSFNDDYFTIENPDTQ
ncbi:hypothetical protein BU17DRAFT_61387 [Hysterangium stoloniferum]|nr:hypothetical protein BU17DRAFT_61387 [Hysterangium stoloniferum]